MCSKAVFNSSQGLVLSALSAWSHPWAKKPKERRVQSEGQGLFSGGLTAVTSVSVVRVVFILRINKHRQPKKKEAEQWNTVCGSGPSWRGEQQPARATRTNELFVGPCDPKWETCHTADLWDLAGACETGAAGPPGLSTTLQIPGCHINPGLNPTSPFPVIDSYIFFSSPGAAKQHPVQLKAIQLQDRPTKHTLQEKLMAFGGGDGQICV